LYGEEGRRSVGGEQEGKVKEEYGVVGCEGGSELWTLGREGRWMGWGLMGGGVRGEGQTGEGREVGRDRGGGGEGKGG